MIICKNCNTPNQENKTQCDNCGQTITASSETVIEYMPTWLNLLLTKYGEQPGPLVGLEEPSFPTGTSLDNEADSGHVSDILNQIAEEGIDPTAEAGGFSSVEWGAGPVPTPPSTTVPAEEPGPGSIDSFLDTLGADTGSFEQPQVPPQQPTTPDLPPFDFEAGSEQALPEIPPPPVMEDTSDWLIDTFSQSPPTPEAPTQFDSAPTPESEPTLPALESEPAPLDEDVPDWLSEALETPPAITELSPSEQAPVAAAQPSSTEEIPDWLSEALDEPPPEVPATPAVLTTTFGSRR